MEIEGRNFSVGINIPTREALMTEVAARFASKQGFALSTLNLDHVAKMETDDAYRDSYKKQDLIVADGNPIVWLSRLAGRPVELQPGSDLVIPLATRAAESGVSVALVGSSEASLASAAESMKSAVVGLDIVLEYAPVYGFDPFGEDADHIFEMLNESGAQLCFVALGAPKQEEFASRGRDLCPTIGFASIGAGLDFLSGTQVRAPKWMRYLALEWFWRFLTNPRRFGKRYALCMAALPSVTKNALGQRKNKP